MIALPILQSYKNSPWKNLTSFSSILFFILFADALLSYWVPNFLQDSLGSAFLMGIVMSFSSVVGLISDLVFPQALKGFTVRKLLLLAILSSFLFAACLLFGLSYPTIFVFFVAMAVWGIYYEFLHFSQAQFVADSIPFKLRSSGWALIGIFRNLAYFLGPLVAGVLLYRGETTFLLYVLVLLSLALLVYFAVHSKHERKITIEPSRVNLFKEVSHWKVLFKSVWAVIVISLVMGLIDATFWTVGAVWTENLASDNILGSLVLPAYQLPSLFMGVIVSRWGIYKGKKRLAEKYLLLAGIFLSLLYFDFPIFIYILIIFISAVYLSVSMPLVEAVYSDITARMGIERKHLVGLSASSISLAYIISPAVSGFLSSVVGEKMTFAIIGVLTAGTAVALLFLTPKKTRLPRAEIKKWKVDLVPNR